MLVHLVAHPVIANYILVQPWCQSKKLGAASEGLFTKCLEKPYEESQKRANLLTIRRLIAT